MGKLQSKSSEELDDNSLKLLLEFTTISLELGSGVTTEDDGSDFTELDESSFFEDEDFSFSLLLDRSSTGAEDDDRTELLDCNVTLEEDDSIPRSSFCPADADDESSHAAKNANNTEKNK